MTKSLAGPLGTIRGLNGPIAAGETKAAVARGLGISRATVYQYLAKGAART
jgi:DNA invertase Pin-like site-specific DNA recombinase